MDTLERMKRIWSEVFVRDDLTDDADFFLLGGDSMVATVLMLHIEEAFDVVVDPVEIFETPTLWEFAQRVENIARMPIEQQAEESVL